MQVLYIQKVYCLRLKLHSPVQALTHWVGIPCADHNSLNLVHANICFLASSNSSYWVRVWTVRLCWGKHADVIKWGGLYIDGGMGPRNRQLQWPHLRFYDGLRCGLHRLRLRCNAKRSRRAPPSILTLWCCDVSCTVQLTCPLLIHQFQRMNQVWHCLCTDDYKLCCASVLVSCPEPIRKSQEGVWAQAYLEIG